MTKKKPNPQPSPWRRGPHCATPAAKLAHIRYRKRGAAQARRKPTP